MIHKPRTIHVEPGSDLDRLLRRPVDDQVRLADERDIWAGYDPARVLHALQRSAGALQGVDRQQLLRDLAEQRG